VLLDRIRFDRNIHCDSKNVMSNFLRELHQLLTDFENSFTVGNSNKLSIKIYIIFLAIS